jgi:hypothetical protein
MICKFETERRKMLLSPTLRKPNRRAIAAAGGVAEMNGVDFPIR